MSELRERTIDFASDEGAAAQAIVEIASGARTVVTDNPGCIMHLRGGVDAKHLQVKILHIAELMAAHLRR